MITISRLWILVVCDRDPDVSPAHSNREHRPGSGVGVSGQWSAAGYHAPPRACTRTQGLWRVRGGNLWLDNVDTRTQSHWFIWAPKSRRGLEWLVGAAVSLSLRAVSCLSYVPEGSWAACHKYHRGFELLSCAREGSWVHLLTYHRYFECTCMRTGGLLSAPA